MFVYIYIYQQEAHLISGPRLIPGPKLIVGPNLSLEPHLMLEIIESIWTSTEIIE